MSKPFDATLKAILEVSPADWPRLVGMPCRRAEVVDADVSTITAAADKVLRLHSPDAILHLDFQAGPDRTLPGRGHYYNAALGFRHDLPVRSVMVLLRPQAALRSINGVYQRWLPGQPDPYLTFRYDVVRVWQLPADQLLAGGLGTLPLAPISAVTEADLPGVIERIERTLESPKHRQVAGQLWTAVDVLMGLRYERGLVEQLLQGVRGMKESVTYQAIVEEGIQKGVEKGRLEGVRHVLLRQGELLFGEPAGPAARARVESVSSLERLEELTARVLRVKTWDELLADVPRPQPRRGRKKKS